MSWGASPRCLVKRRRFQSGQGRWVFSAFVCFEGRCADLSRWSKLPHVESSLFLFQLQPWTIGSRLVLYLFSLAFCPFCLFSFSSFPFSWHLHAFHISSPSHHYISPRGDMTRLQLHFCMPSEGRHCNIPLIKQLIVDAIINFCSM